MATKQKENSVFEHAATLNMSLRKNQALTDDGRLYIQEVLVGQNVKCKPANEEDAAQKGCGRVVLCYSMYNKETRKTEETIVCRDFPEDAMTSHCVSIPGLHANGEPYTSTKCVPAFPERIHNLINGGDAVNNLMTQHMSVQVYATKYYSKGCVSAAAASRDKIVILGRLDKGCKDFSVSDLVDFLNRECINMGWPGTVSGILRSGTLLEISFCHEPVYADIFRAEHTLIQGKMVSAFNLATLDKKKKLPFYCTFRESREDYKMLAPGSDDITRNARANLVYVDKMLPVAKRASLRTAIRSMGITADAIQKEKDNYYQDCLRHPDNGHAPIVKRTSVIRATAVINYLEIWFLSGARKFEYKDLMQFVAVYSSYLFQFEETYTGKIAFANVVAYCLQILNRAKMQGGILIDILDEDDIKRCVGRIRQEARAYRPSAAAKALRFTDEETQALMKAVAATNARCQEESIKELRHKTQNKTRDMQNRLKVQTRIEKRKKCVKMYRAGKTVEEIAAVITGCGFSMPNIKRCIRRWCEEYDAPAVQKKEKLDSDLETGSICDAPNSDNLSIGNTESPNTAESVKAFVCDNDYSNSYSFNIEKTEVTSNTLHKPSQDDNIGCTEAVNPENNCEMLESLWETPMWELPAHEVCAADIPAAHKENGRFIECCLPVCNALCEFLDMAIPQMVEQLSHNIIAGIEEPIDSYNVYISAVGLMFHWLDAGFPAAVRSYDRKLQLQKQLSKIDFAVGGTAVASIAPGAYITTGEFWHDFPFAAVVKMGMRRIRQLFHQLQMLLPADAFSIERKVIGMQIPWKLEELRTLIIRPACRDTDDLFESVTWDSITGVPEAIAAAAEIKGDLSATVVPMPNVCACA